MAMFDCKLSAIMLCIVTLLRMDADLLGVVGIVETEASHCLDMLRGQRGQQESDVGNIFRDIVSAKDVARHDPCLPCFGNISDAAGENGVAVVCFAVPSKEAD